MPAEGAMKLAQPISSQVQLALSRICKSFPRDGKPLPVLNSVGLDVNPGELVALVGPSGCGKTTLLHIISGLVQPDSGAICIDNRRVTDARSHVAYMQQKDLLLPWRKALANTLLGPEIVGANAAISEQEARALFAEFGLEGFEQAFPEELSGGMRQRVALVRTLLCQKSILLLDEPFGALDALTRRQLQDWFLQAWEEFGFSALLVTHDVEEALVLADRVIVLSARPARVKTSLAISVPRPRIPTDSEFVRGKAELLAWLNSDDAHADQGGTAHA
jgi:ABC-type nitrate/sulfonate/bicarbonate transport system ATPase subunit